MKKPVVLICEDNIVVQDILKEYMKKENIEPVSALTGEEAVKLFETQSPDVVILDIMLPGISGLDVCKKIRSVSKVPILILSARGSAPDRVHGLELGADDYVTKPFSPKEVIIRVKKLIDRSGFSGETGMLKVGNLEVLSGSNIISIDGKHIEMTNKEIQVLEYLIKNKGKIISREELIGDIWEKSHADDLRVVDTLIKRIRRKCSGYECSFKLVSVYGKGYKIEEA